jgi:hypothetical protein
MAIQLSTLVRNAMLDAMETQIGTSAKIEIYTGAPPANCAASATGTKLAEFALASDWAANAASGSKAFNSISPTTGLLQGRRVIIGLPARTERPQGSREPLP